MKREHSYPIPGSDLTWCEKRVPREKNGSETPCPACERGKKAMRERAREHRSEVGFKRPRGYDAHAYWFLDGVIAEEAHSSWRVAQDAATAQRCSIDLERRNLVFKCRMCPTCLKPDYSGATVCKHYMKADGRIVEYPMVPVELAVKAPGHQQRNSKVGG